MYDANSMYSLRRNKPCLFIFIFVHHQLGITVEDENDNSPQFDPAQYEANALETLVRDTSLVRVRATDDDAGRNGDIVYTVIDGDEGKFMRGIVQSEEGVSVHPPEINF